MQELGVGDVLEESGVDAVRGGDVLEADGLEGHGECERCRVRRRGERERESSAVEGGRKVG